MSSVSQGMVSQGIDCTYCDVDVTAWLSNQGLSRGLAGVKAKQMGTLLLGTGDKALPLKAAIVHVV